MCCNFISPTVRQAWVVLGVILSYIGLGMHFGHPSNMVHGLMQPDSDIKVDLATVTWMVSTSSPASLGGYLMSSLLMDWCGRKKTFAISVLPGILEWISMYFGRDIRILFIGRLAGGITFGALAMLAAHIIAEYTSPEHRGTFLTLKTLAISIGFTIIHVLGNYYNWRTISLIAILPYAMAFGIACTWAESPSWLVLKKRYQKCEEAFYMLRGTGDRARKELEDLIKGQSERNSRNRKQLGFLGNITVFFKKFTQKDFLKPLFIIFTAMVLMEVSGRHFYPAYALQIIESITGNNSASSYYTLSIDIMVIISGLAASVLVRLMKRRTLLFSTTVAAFVILSAACMYLFLASRGVVSENNSFIPLAMFIVYFILANIGPIPITINLLGEIFPLAHKSVGSVMVGLILSMLVMITLRTTPHLLKTLNVYGIFGIFGTIQLITLIMLYFILPETKDKTLQEIEDYFYAGGFKYNDKKVDSSQPCLIPMLTSNQGDNRLSSHIHAVHS